MQCGQLLVLAQLPQAVNLALLMWGRRLLLLMSLLQLLLLLGDAAACASSNRIVAPLRSGREGCLFQLRQAGT